MRATAASEPVFPIFYIKTARTCPAAGTSPLLAVNVPSLWSVPPPAAGPVGFPSVPSLPASCGRPGCRATPARPGPHSCSRLWSRCVLGPAQAVWLEFGRDRPGPCALRSLKERMPPSSHWSTSRKHPLPLAQLFILFHNEMSPRSVGPSVCLCEPAPSQHRRVRTGAPHHSRSCSHPATPGLVSSRPSVFFLGFTFFFLFHHLRPVHPLGCGGAGCVWRRESRAERLCWSCCSALSVCERPRVFAPAAVGVSERLLRTAGTCGVQSADPAGTAGSG